MSAIEDAVDKAWEKGREEMRAEIVSLLKDLRDELCDPQVWSTKRATWNLAVLAAEGKFNRKGETSDADE